jgi:hypothetical protein
MIARHWRGWTEVHNANAYECFLKTRVLPNLKRLVGYRGGYILRSDGADEVEFVVVNFFESMESVRLLPGTTIRLPCSNRRHDYFCHGSSPLPGTMPVSGARRPQLQGCEIALRTESTRNCTEFARRSIGL